jgi:hypothetical protein
MRQCRKTRSAGHSTFARATRTVILGLPKNAKPPRAGSREAKLWAVAVKRSYLGLLVGLALGVALLVLLLAEE